MQRSIKPAPALKALVFCMALIPLARLVAGAALYPDWLGANAAELGVGRRLEGRHAE